MAANRTDVCVEPPQFLSTWDKKIQTVLLKIELLPAIPIKTLLASDFTLDKLLEARNTIFEAAKDKYRERSNVQHGHGDKATMPNIANFTMKARRSNETVADDIRELCLYMFDHRDGFPKSCLTLSVPATYAREYPCLPQQLGTQCHFSTSGFFNISMKCALTVQCWMYCTVHTEWLWYTF